MKLILSIFIFITLFWFCSDSTSSNDENPERPTMVAKQINADLQLIEYGIDAYTSTTNDIIIMWNKHPDANNIKRYDIWHSDDVGGQSNYTLLGSRETQFNHDTVYVHQNASLDTVHYYFVIAIDKNNNKSEQSDTVHYKLIEKATNLKYDETGLNELTFSAKYELYKAPRGSILRIEEIFKSEEPWYYIDYVDQFVHSDGFIEYVISGNTYTKIFSNPSNYHWRIDLVVDDLEYNGSETDWQEFNN